MVKPDFDTVMERFRERAAQRMADFEAELAQANNTAANARKAVSEQPVASISAAPQLRGPRVGRPTAVRSVLRSQRG
ncbi:hypothetical protein [Corynebacterium hindlerae]|uniref:hypothetical protein n=1 Tax=Corynebacterium hindlerae TaxID=699041 RepID=UPI0031B6AF2F